MIWTVLICSNFIIFRLNTKQLLAQHIPLLGYTELPSSWELLDGFTEPFFRGVAYYSWTATFVIPLPVLTLWTQLNTVLSACACLHN
jgi:hypothetical protein